MERVVLRAIPNEEFVYKKTNHRNIYVEYGSTEDMLEKKMHSVKAVWRFGRCGLK